MTRPRKATQYVPVAPDRADDRLDRLVERMRLMPTANLTRYSWTLHREHDAIKEVERGRGASEEQDFLRDACTQARAILADRRKDHRPEAAAA
jgi:hypothetical protein